MNRSRKNYIIAALILFLVCAGGIVTWLVMGNAKTEDPQAEIFSDGRLISTIVLSESATFTVNSENGYNTIKVENGKISVVEADCPDKVCIHTGAISGGTIPIICLPNKLEIKITSGNDIDAVIN